MRLIFRDLKIPDTGKTGETSYGGLTSDSDKLPVFGIPEFETQVQQDLGKD